MPHHTCKLESSNATDVFRRCLYHLLRARSVIIIIMCTQGELSKSRKQHLHASYNSQNMKFHICHDIVVVYEYVRAFAQIIQQINTTYFSHIFPRRRSNKRVGLKGQLAPHCVPWLKNSIMAYKRLSTSLGSKTLNNTSSLGLGGTKI